jgi:hypothetical protein
VQRLVSMARSLIQANKVSTYSPSVGDFCGVNRIAASLVVAGLSLHHTKAEMQSSRAARDAGSPSCPISNSEDFRPGHMTVVLANPNDIFIDDSVFAAMR